MSGWRANRSFDSLSGRLPSRKAPGGYKMVRARYIVPLPKTWRRASHVKITSVPRTDKKGASVGQSRADQCVDSGKVSTLGHPTRCAVPPTPTNLHGYQRKGLTKIAIRN